MVPQQYIIFVYVCITRRGSIDLLGMQANFTPDSLDGAWWVAAVALGLICCSTGAALARNDFRNVS